MPTRRVRPHRSAQVARRFEIAATDKYLSVTVHVGRASDGYKSDFDRRPVAWVTYEISFPNGDYRTWGERYAGTRLTLLRDEMLNYRAAVLVEPTVTDVDDSGWLVDVSPWGLV